MWEGIAQRFEPGLYKQREVTWPAPGPEEKEHPEPEIRERRKAVDRRVGAAADTFPNQREGGIDQKGEGGSGSDARTSHSLDIESEGSR
jgi:hypothetical protein